MNSEPEKSAMQKRLAALRTNRTRAESHTEKVVPDTVPDGLPRADTESDYVKNEINTVVPKIKTATADIGSSKMSVGDTFTFGKILWDVLDVQNGRALLLSHYALFNSKPFHNENVPCTWESCSLRKWLNYDFISKFTREEQAKIISVTNNNEGNYWYWTKGGNPTQDKVFCLSLAEVVKYFGDSGALDEHQDDGIRYYYLDDDGNEVKIDRPDKRKDCCFSDQYDERRIAHIIFDDFEHSICYWLRSPGKFSNTAIIVDSSGCIDMSGDDVDDDVEYIGVRPAMWIKLNGTDESVDKVANGKYVTGQAIIDNMSESELDDWLSDLLGK